MRASWLLLAGIMGCSNEVEVAPVVDAEGDWTAEVLVNTSTDSPGGEVSSFGTLTLEPATYVPDSIDHIPGDYVGNATFESIAYAAQGSLAEPDVDQEGEPLYENVGSVVLRGTWRADAVEEEFDEPNTSLTIDLNCEEVNLTSDRTDLQAICGDPFFVNLTASCERPAGSTTLQCNFSSAFSGIVFSRI